jgi:hypothetical protein
VFIIDRETIAYFALVDQWQGTDHFGVVCWGHDDSFVIFCCDSTSSNYILARLVIEQGKLNRMTNTDFTASAQPGEQRLNEPLLG